MKIETVTDAEVKVGEERDAKKMQEQRQEEATKEREVNRIEKLKEKDAIENQIQKDEEARKERDARQIQEHKEKEAKQIDVQTEKEAQNAKELEEHKEQIRGNLLVSGHFIDVV